MLNRYKSVKERLDILLHSRGLAESRERAKALILSGAVIVDGEKADKVGLRVRIEAEIVVKKKAFPYVSRGGCKLEWALKTFCVDVAGKVAIDVGASTGGFTDCLLQRGAEKVYAIDVGYGQLAWQLRQDPRVVVIERQNIRSLPAALIPAPIDLATVDVSFISLEKVIPCILPLLHVDAVLIPLVKPQFEVGKGEVGKGGIVRSAEKHQEVLARICGKADAWGLEVVGTTPSPILGQKGNAEFLVYFKKVEAEATNRTLGIK
ncbi:MAG: TlyA family RNA methyltransferase [Nitrospira sp.]